MTKPIYLDYNATTPHDPEVIEAMRPYLEEHFGNPSSSHWYGVQTKNAVETAREQVACLLNCDPAEVVFTSGGTESNNWAIKGIAFAHRERGNHIITSRIEHPAVTEVCRYLEEQGFAVTWLPVDEYGMVRVDEAERAVTPQTILVTVMHANNEVGTIQPIEDISQIAKKKGIPFHTDAAQSVGKIMTDVNRLGVDLMSVAGHKLYAPKGIGALYVRRGTRLSKIMHGAGHERGMRAGTENVLEIVGLGKACELARRDLDGNGRHMREMKDRLHTGLCEMVQAVKHNGHPSRCLPNTLSLSFQGVEAGELVAALAERVAISAGAACHGAECRISHVLEAMGVPVEWGRGTIRFSTGKTTTPAEIDKAVQIISSVLQR